MTIKVPLTELLHQNLHILAPDTVLNRALLEGTPAAATWPFSDGSEDRTYKSAADSLHTENHQPVRLLYSVSMPSEVASGRARLDA